MLLRQVQYFHAVVRTGSFPDTQVHIQNGNHEARYQLLNSNQLDMVLNDQRRAFSNKYVNSIIKMPWG